MNINVIYELQRKNNEQEIKYRKNKELQELRNANINAGINVVMSHIGYAIISAACSGLYRS